MGLDRREFLTLCGVAALGATLSVKSACDMAPKSAYEVLTERGGRFAYFRGEEVSGLILSEYGGRSIPFKKYGNIAPGDRIFIIEYDGRPIGTGAEDFTVEDPRLLTVKPGYYDRYTV